MVALSFVMTEINSLRDPLHAHGTPTAPRVAVVLNGNARAVTDALIRDVRMTLDQEQLYVSRSLEQWKFIARRIVNKGYDVVLLGGGDGTFAQCVTDIMALRPRRTPSFGVLRLGTGNGLASALGVSGANLRGFTTELRRARQASFRQQLPMLRVEDRLAPFTGVGLDSLILEDYNAVKRAFRDTVLQNLMQGGMGYATAIAGKSLRRSIFEPLPKLVIRNEGAPAPRVDIHGEPTGEIVPYGGILFEGEANIAACSAVPYYGLGLKLFPHALTRVDRFALRVARINPLRVMARLPALFAGEYQDEGINDFLCTAVSYHLDRPTALQIGGDEIGRRTRVKVSMTQIPVIWGDADRPAQASRPASVLSLDAFRKALSL